jgi:hypothetical protein
MSSSSRITNDKIASFELGPYLEEHRETLDKLSKSDMPPKSRMFYKEVIADKHHETDHLLIKYNIINFSNNRKNFLRINAEMTPDLVIKHEEIIFSSNGVGGGDSREIKRTIVHHDNAVHKEHKEWLKKLHDKHHHHHARQIG